MFPPDSSGPRLRIQRAADSARSAARRPPTGASVNSAKYDAEAGARRPVSWATLSTSGLRQGRGWLEAIFPPRDPGRRPACARARLRCRLHPARSEVLVLGPD